MRKDILAGLGIAVLAAASGATYVYLNNRALVEVDAAFAAIRATGAKASHGRVSVALLRRHIEIEDIVLQPTPGDAEIKLSNLGIDGVNVATRDFAAQRIEVTNLVARDLGGVTPGAQATLKIPSLVVSDVRSTRDLPAGDAALMTNADPLTRAMLMFSTVSAASATAPTLELQTTATIPVAATPAPATPGAVDRQPEAFNTLTTYTDVKLEGLQGGRISRAAFARATLGPTGSGNPVATGTMHGITVADIDLMPAFGIGLASRTPRDGYHRIQGKFTAGAYALKMFDGTEVAIAGASGTGMEINPDRLSYLQMRDMIATLSSLPPQPTPAQLKVMFGTVVKFYEGIRFDGIELREMKMSVAASKPAPQPFTMAIGRMSMSGFDRGKLREFRIDNLSGARTDTGAAPAPIKLGSFSLTGFDFVKLMKVGMEAAATPGKPPAPEKIGELLSSLEGFEVLDVAIPLPRTGQIVQIDQAKTTWEQFVGDLPTKIGMSFKGSMPVDPNDPTMAVLSLSGLKTLAMALEAKSDWDPATRTSPASVSLSLDQLGSLTADGIFANVPRSAFSIQPGVQNVVLPDVEIGPLSLKLQDKGLIKLARAMLGVDASGAPAADPLAAFKQALVDSAKPATNLALVLDAASRFIATPGQTLTLKFSAKAPVLVGYFMGPTAPKGPDALVTTLDLFNIQVAVAP